MRAFSMAKGLVFKRMRDFNRTTDLKIPVLRIARNFKNCVTHA